MTAAEDSDNSLQAIRQWTLVQPLVSAYLGGIVASKADRDDLLQETAVAVLNSYANYDSARSFDGWVLGIAQNVLRNHFRKLSRDRLIFDDTLLVGLAESFEVVAAEQTERLDRLNECLKKLAPAARTLCELRYRDELSIELISQRLGKTTAAVAKTLQRLREQLRGCIESTGLSGEPS